jgi:hypothetical protein
VTTAVVEQTHLPTVTHTRGRDHSIDKCYIHVSIIYLYLFDHGLLMIARPVDRVTELSGYV